MRSQRSAIWESDVCPERDGKTSVSNEKQGERLERPASSQGQRDKTMTVPLGVCLSHVQQHSIIICLEFKTCKPVAGVFFSTPQTQSQSLPRLHFKHILRLADFWEPLWTFLPHLEAITHPAIVCYYITQTAPGHQSFPERTQKWINHPGWWNNHSQHTFFKWPTNQSSLCFLGPISTQLVCH